MRGNHETPTSADAHPDHSLIPPGDHQALAARIADLVRDPELRARLGRAGRITAERRFERSRLAAQLIPLYQRLAGHSAPQAQAHVAATL